jgi:hypothetical protein
MPTSQTPSTQMESPHRLLTPSIGVSHDNQNCSPKKERII